MVTTSEFEAFFAALPGMAQLLAAQKSQTIILWDESDACLKKTDPYTTNNQFCVTFVDRVPRLWLSVK